MKFYWKNSPVSGRGTDEINNPLSSNSLPTFSHPVGLVYANLIPNSTHNKIIPCIWRITDFVFTTAIITKGKVSFLRKLISNQCFRHYFYIKRHIYATDRTVRKFSHITFTSSDNSHWSTDSHTMKPVRRSMKFGGGSVNFEARMRNGHAPAEWLETKNSKEFLSQGTMRVRYLPHSPLRWQVQIWEAKKLRIGDLSPDTGASSTVHLLPCELKKNVSVDHCLKNPGIFLIRTRIFFFIHSYLILKEIKEGSKIYSWNYFWSNMQCIQCVISN